MQNLVYLGVIFVFFVFLVDASVARLAAALAILLQDAGSFRVGNEADAMLFAKTAGAEFMAAVSPVVGFIMVAGVGALIMQNAPSPVLKRIAPDFSRISPGQGLRRLFSPGGLLEMGKTLLRFSAFALCSLMLLRSERVEFQNAVYADPLISLLLTRKAVLAVLGVFIGVSALLTIVDLPTTRGLWHSNLKMTKQELRDEHKEAEGDPHIKGRRRAMAKSRLRARSLLAVEKATLVIANPTHFAVALRYVREEGGAPKVVAKGQDLIALQIRRIAEENAIPVVEDKALARSLYAKVDVDQMIPIEFYRTVAEILTRLQSKRKGRYAR